MVHPGSAARVVHELIRQGATVAVAESLTGGELCARLIDVPGASAAVRGAVVAYHNTVKVARLGLSAEELARTGAVTQEVAVQMAEGIRVALESDTADYGVATTGVAGPDPDPITGQPAGVVFIAVVGPEGRQWTTRLDLAGDRQDIRDTAVSMALGLMEDALGLSGERGE